MMLLSGLLPFGCKRILDKGVWTCSALNPTVPWGVRLIGTRRYRLH
jgi:hypothetical protein